MSIPLVDIIRRLKAENLHGPIFKKSTELLDPWKNGTNEFQDLDSRDPRFTLAKLIQMV
jgi:hypothetical protein